MWVGRLFDMLVVQSVNFPEGQLVCRLINWLVGRPVGHWVGWSVGQLVGFIYLPGHTDAQMRIFTQSTFAIVGTCAITHLLCNN